MSVIERDYQDVDGAECIANTRKRLLNDTGRGTVRSLSSRGLCDKCMAAKALICCFEKCDMLYYTSLS